MAQRTSSHGGQGGAPVTAAARPCLDNAVTITLRLGRQPIAYGALLLVGAAWASNFLFAPLALTELSPATVAFWRWGLAFLFVLPIAWSSIAADLPIEGVGFWHLIACAALGFAGFAALSYDAVVTGARLDAMVLLAAAPLVALVFARLSGSETHPPQVWLGVLIGGLGIAWGATRGNLDAAALLASRPPSLSMVAAILCFAAYVVALRGRSGLRPLTVFALAALLAALGLFPLMLFDLADRPIAVPSWRTVAVLAFLAIVPSIGGFVLFTWATAIIGGARSSQVLHLVPVFGAAGSVLLFGEELHTHHAIAALLVGCGLVVAFAARPGLR